MALRVIWPEQCGCSCAEGDASVLGASARGSIQHLHMSVLLQWHLHRSAEQRGMEWHISGVPL